MINRQVYLYMLVIAFLALVNFYPVFNNDFSLDDAYYTTQVADITTFPDVAKVFDRKFSEVDYRPMASLSFALEKVFFGEISPGRSHAINWVFYVLGCCLFLLFIYRLPEEYRAKDLAPIAAILFTVLPLHTSMVANIKCRDGLMSFMFGMIYLHGIITLFNASPFKNKIILGLIGVGCLWISVYSKLDAFNFLMITPLVVLLFYRQINWKYFLRVLIIVAVAYKVFTFLFETWSEDRNEVLDTDLLVADKLIFTENPIVDYNSFSQLIAFSIQTVFEYIKMVFRPFGHYYYYGFDMVPVLPISSPIIWLKLVIILGFIALGVWMFFKEKLLGFGIAFFFICLIYCSNLVTPVAGIVADRYVFIASAGACICVGMLLLKISEVVFQRFLAKNIKPTEAPLTKKTKVKTVDVSKKEPFMAMSANKVSILMVLLIALVYLPFNITRSAEWSNFFSLFEADLPHITHHSYEANRIAIKNYVERAIDSDDPVLRQKYFAKGLEYGQNAVAIYDKGVLVQEGIVMALYGLGDFGVTVNQARHVIQKFDSTEVGWRILTEYHYSKRNLDSAAIGYKKLTKIVPNDPNVYLFYVSTLQEAGRMDEAVAYCDSLISVNALSYTPYQAKGYLYLNAKDSSNAVLNLEKAFEMGFRDNQMLDVLGMYWFTRDKVKWEDLRKYMIK